MTGRRAGDGVMMAEVERAVAHLRSEGDTVDALIADLLAFAAGVAATAARSGQWPGADRNLPAAAVDLSRLINAVAA